MSPYWQCRAYCRHDSRCIKVRMSIRNEPRSSDDRIPVKVIIEGRCTHVNGENQLNAVSDVRLLPNRRHLSGKTRADAVLNLRKSGQSATEHYYQTLGIASRGEYIAGHMSTCQTPGILRQAVYEDKRKEQLHDDMIMELRLQKASFTACMSASKIPGYIQSIGLDPFHVMFYSEGQLQTYIKDFKSLDTVCTIHIDATGSVIRNISGQKQPLYYCIFFGYE